MGDIEGGFVVVPDPVVVAVPPALPADPRPHGRHPADAPIPGPSHVENQPNTTKPGGGRARSSIVAAPRASTKVGQGHIRLADTPSDIITKMMREPLDVYNNGENVYYQTDGASAKLGTKASFTAMPAGWPECLTPVKISWVDKEQEDTKRTWAPAKTPMTIVSVNNGNDFVDPMVLTQLGVLLDSMMLRPLDDRTAQIGIGFHPAGNVNVGALAALFCVWRRRADRMSQDQAPLLRAGLAALSFAHPTVIESSTTLGQNLSYSSKPLVYKDTVVQKVDALEKGNFILPLDNGSTKVRWITMSEYKQLLLNGIRTSASGVSVDDLNDAAVVPIKVHDLEADWLVHYAAAFTDTAWWLGSVAHKFTMPDANDNVVVWGVPIACNVYVPGATKLIVFVILDAGERPVNVKFGSYQGMSNLADCNDGAAIIYGSFGATEANANPPTSDQLIIALAQVCEYVGADDVEKRVDVMLAELAFRLPMGYTVLTEKSKTATQFWGPATVRQGGGTDKVMIADKEIVSYKTWSDLAGDTFELVRDWSVSPFGLFPSSEGSLTLTYNDQHKDDKVRWRITKINMRTTSYVATELTHLERILMASDVFINSTHCHGTITTHLHYFRHKQFLASFLSLTSAWWYLESGLPITDMNGLGAFGDRPTVSVYKGLMRVMTLGFVIQNNGRASRYMKSDFTTNLAKRLGLTTNSCGFDCIRSLHVPFWAVYGLMCKFIPNIPDDYSIESFTVIKDNEHMQRSDFAIDLDSQDWYKLAMLTSTIGYEVSDSQQKAWFMIELTNYRLTGVSPTLTGWYPHVAIDNARPQYGDEADNWDKSVFGVVELLAIVNPSHRFDMRYSQIPKQSVSSRCRTNGVLSTRMVVELTQPDPFLQWLGETFMSIVPNLIAGDYIGATTTVIASATRSLLEWAFRSKSAE